MGSEVTRYQGPYAAQHGMVGPCARQLFSMDSVDEEHVVVDCSSGLLDLVCLLPHPMLPERMNLGTRH